MLWRNDRVPRPLPAGFIEPCIPSPSIRVPMGPDWVHEIKHDGYRLIVRRDGMRVRLFTRRGYNWTHRFGWIVEAMNRLKVESATIDGEAVVCDADGVSNFDKLHSQRYDDQVVLYAFDLLELNGEDWRPRPLGRRKATLAKILSSAGEGIYLNEHLTGDGANIFKHACLMGLEGVVSKRTDFPYRSGRSKSWIKVKNPKSPAALRIEDGTF
jgi:bifunctional non-homologous end joining protein LigD